MILIKTNQSNLVALTLTEKQTQSNVDWLFQFTNDTTGQIKIFSALDISLATQRYNEFIIIDGPNDIPSSGTMNFRPVGYWSYVIYEMPISSPPDLDPSNALGIVEIGKVLVVDSTVIVTPTYSDNDSINNIVYEG